eukprot:gene25011-biopygen7450
MAPQATFHPAALKAPAACQWLVTSRTAAAMCCLDLLRSPRAGQCNGTTMETNGTQRRQQATNNTVRGD